MKHLKILGLLAIAATALMAFTATASATVTLTSPKGAAFFGKLHAVSEGHATLKPEQLPIIECESTVEGEVTANGTPATGPITHLTFSPCTNDWHVTATAKGTLSVIKKAAGEGTVTSNGATVESTRFGITCRYATSNTDIGVLTDTSKTNATATMHIHGLIPFHSGSPLCGPNPTTWKGSYKITKPDELYID